MKEESIGGVFHYVPLHSSKYGYLVGRFYGEDRYTTFESERIIRLPMYYGLTEDEIMKLRGLAGEEENEETAAEESTAVIGE